VGTALELGGKITDCLQFYETFAESDDEDERRFAVVRLWKVRQRMVEHLRSQGDRARLRAAERLLYEAEVERAKYVQHGQEVPEFADVYVPVARPRKAAASTSDVDVVDWSVGQIRFRLSRTHRRLLIENGADFDNAMLEVPSGEIPRGGGAFDEVVRRENEWVFRSDRWGVRIRVRKRPGRYRLQVDATASGGDVVSRSEDLPSPE
jgi:hypothetical protein